MRASQVRKRLLEEHSRLRLRIHRLDDEVREACHGIRSSGARLEQTTRQFTRALRLHMRHEERALGEILSYQIWGEQRLCLLRHEHRLQERALVALETALRRAFSLRHAADLIFAMARQVEADMQREEDELLKTGVLRDDVPPADCDAF